MPDKRTHRGKHPEDGRYFNESSLSQIRRAVRDLSWLLSNGYAEKSSLKLVGDRFNLSQRQRMAVMRSACSDEDLHTRQVKNTNSVDVAGKKLLLDGYNIITTVETALSGGVVLKARDGSFRDIAGIHGTYRKIQETLPALDLIGRTLVLLHVTGAQWYLDSPVSNSGRLKTLLYQLADENHWNWQVEVVTNPDSILSLSEEIVATSDSIILNRCHKWFDLTGMIIREHIPDAYLIDLSTV
ncbi:MAG: DUF434 domain-containing protein [Sedimentisphaerales bacterium]|nr:DUF434 domain-containing protein [Sedimentisphaerales bacterium]